MVFVINAYAETKKPPTPPNPGNRGGRPPGVASTNVSSIFTTAGGTRGASGAGRGGR